MEALRLGPRPERPPLGGEWRAQTGRRLAFPSRPAGSWSGGHPGSDHRLAAQLETSDRTIGETRREWGLQECSVLKSEPAAWFAEAQAFSRGGSCGGGSGKVKLLKKGFLSGSTSRVSGMASVLGTSRGSGGLSGQLRCKSKRRRRRRSKRKGKDAVPVPARGAPANSPPVCGLRCFQRLPCRLLVGHQRRAERSEFRYLCKRLGASASPEGTANGAEGSAECWLEPVAGEERGRALAVLPTGVWVPPGHSSAIVLPPTLWEATRALGPKETLTHTGIPENEGGDLVPAFGSKLSRRRGGRHPASQPPPQTG